MPHATSATMLRAGSGRWLLKASNSEPPSIHSVTIITVEGVGLERHAPLAATRDEQFVPAPGWNPYPTVWVPHGADKLHDVRVVEHTRHRDLLCERLDGSLRNVLAMQPLGRHRLALQARAVDIAEGAASDLLLESTARDSIRGLRRCGLGGVQCTTSLTN